jgi:hypothetical protein
MNEPKEAHLQVVKQILKYLKNTLDFGTHLTCKGDEIYFVFTYGVWGCDLDSKHSTSIMLHKVGNFIVHWLSKLQYVKTLSTIEA